MGHGRRELQALPSCFRRSGMTRTTHVQIRVTADEKRRIEDAAKRTGKSLSDYLCDLALSQRAPAPAQDTRRFAQTAPVTTKPGIEKNTITSRPFKPDFKEKWRGDYKRAG
jgi:uncharacterized protein (DUF1778 family)